MELVLLSSNCVFSPSLNPRSNARNEWLGGLTGTIFFRRGHWRYCAGSKVLNVPPDPSLLPPFAQYIHHSGKHLSGKTMAFCP